MKICAGNVMEEYWRKRRADKMFYRKKLLCIVAVMLMLCGCSQKGDSAAALADSSRQTEQQREAKGVEITVIDTLPAVDETVPRELTPLPSSEIINIMGHEEAQQHIRQEDGTFSDEASIYDYMEQYAEERQITWECSRENSFWYDYLIWKGEGGGYEYQVAVPVTDEGAGSWLIQAQIKKGADSPEDCLYAASVFMQTFHGNPYIYCVKEGDTLYGIARTYLGDGDSYPRLARINGLADPDFIYEGQLIEIPIKLR